MVQLVAYTQSGDNPVYLDLGDISIKANYSSVEIQDISQRKSEYTNAFTLPFSKTNNDFFGHFYEVNLSDASFRADIKAKCSIYVDSNLQFDGYLQLIKVDKLKESYEVLSFGDIANISKELGESKLNELDLSKYNHLLTLSNVEQSWAGNIDYVGSQPNGSEILYPIIDYGQAYTGESISSNDGAIRVRNLRPAIKLKSLFDAIINKAGYTYTSTFLSSTFFTSQYMTLANDLEGSITNSVDGFKVGKNSDETMPTGLEIIDFNNETLSDGFYDVGGNFNSSTSAYTIPSTGVYQFKVRVVIQNTANITDTVKLLLNVSTFSSDIEFGQIQLTNGVAYNMFTFETLSTVLNQGDVVKIKTNNDTGSTFVIKEDYTFGSQNFKTSFELINAPASVEGGEVDFSAGNNIFPKDSQVDFIKSILARYNLIVEVDNENPKNLNIIPLQDYYDAGTSKDWTDKLDENKSIQIQPTTTIRKKSLNLKDLEDSDTLNNYWKNHKGGIYNQKKFNFYGDFGSGELTIPTIFSSFAPKKMSNNQMYIAKHFEWADGEAKIVKTKPKLFYYSGKKSLSPSSYYKIFSEITEGYTTKTEYPFAHHYSMSGTQVQSTDKDIRFGSRDTFSFDSLVASQTSNDVYNDYWRKYLSNIYNKDAKIMNANFHLTAQDISSFKYNDKIFIKDCYWRVNKISSYAMGVDNSTKVELIKILDINVDSENIVDDNCKDTISTYNLNGTTSWVDAAGSSVSPSQICCEAEGLSFINSQCWWNFNVIIDNPEQPPVTYSGNEILIGTEDSEIALKGTVTQIGDTTPADDTILNYNASDKAVNWVRRKPPYPASEFESSGTITNYINITPNEFKLTNRAGTDVYTNDNGGSVRLSSTLYKMYAMKIIPRGLKATHVGLLGSTTGFTFRVYSGDIASKTTTSLGSGTVNVELDITDLSSSSRNYLIIEVNTNNLTDEVYGAYIKLE